MSEIQAASELRETFSDLAVSLIKELVEKHTSAEEFRKSIATLPLSLNKKTTLPINNVDQIENLMLLTDLFHLLNANIWNFFDYQVLEYVIDKFGSDAIQDTMSQFISSFRKFEQNTVLYDFFECYPGRMQKLPGYTEVTANIDGNPKHFTLAELNQFRHNVCIKFLPPLSEKAMLFYKHQRDDFSITWILPSDLARQLQIASTSPENHEFFQKHRVILSVNLEEEEDKGVSGKHGH